MRTRAQSIIASMHIGIVVIGMGCLSTSRAWGQEFRIETDVFQDEVKEPFAQTLTIFTNDRVYDFLLTGVEEVTLFDRNHNRFVLMDAQRKMKTELALDDIESFIADLKSRLNDQQRTLLLIGDARATEEEDGWLRLSNDRVTYRVECIKPKTKAAVEQYREFADWYARLNAMRRGNLPPFMRIHLDAEIASRGLIPKTVERTISEHTLLRRKEVTLRSRHLVNWRLSTADRKLIERADTYQVSFPTVTFREYFQLADMASNDRPRRE